MYLDAISALRTGLATCNHVVQSLRMRCSQCVRRNLGVSRRKITSSRRTRTWTARRWKRFVKIWKKANSRQPRTWVVQLVKKKSSTTRRPAWTPARMFKQRWCSITKALIQQHRRWSAWTFWNRWLCLSRLSKGLSEWHGGLVDHYGHDATLRKNEKRDPEGEKRPLGSAAEQGDLKKCTLVEIWCEARGKPMNLVSRKAANKLNSNIKFVFVKKR